MATNTISIKLEVKDDGTIGIAGQKLGDLNKTVSEGGGPVESLSTSWIGLTAKIAAGSAAIYGVTSFLGKFVNEAAEAEQIENRLRYALETTGYTWQYAKQAVDAYATSIQATTRFSDEQARQALTDMMMYTNDFSKAQQGARLAMDMSIRTGHDLSSSSRLIGMAMSGNVEMLGRYIPELKNLDVVLGKNATMAQKAEYAMKVLNEKFGGTAQNDVKTYAGTVAQFKNAWSDLKEEIGYGLLPVLKDTFKWLTDILRNMEAQRKLQKEAGGSFWSTGPVPGMPYYTPPIKYESDVQTRIKAFESQRLATETKKDIFPAEVGKDKKLEDLPKTLKDNWESFNPTGYIKIYTDGILTGIESSAEWNEKEKERFDILSKIKSLEESITKSAIEQMHPSPSEEKKMMEDYTKALEEQRIKLIQIQNLVKDFGWEDYASGASDAADDATRELTRMSIQVGVVAKQTNEFMKGLGQTMSSSIGSAMSSMILGTQSAGEALKQAWSSIASYIIQKISEMMVEWLLFEKTTSGGGKSGLNLLGIVGSAIGLGGSAGGSYGGGSPSGGFYVPESRAGQGGGANTIVYNDYRTTTNNYIDAIDQKSIEERVTGPVIRGMGKPKYGEVMKNLIRKNK